MVVPQLETLKYQSQAVMNQVTHQVALVVMIAEVILQALTQAALAQVVIQVDAKYLIKI